MKSAFRSLKWGFLTLLWNLLQDFPILKWNNFRAISALEFDVEKDGRIIFPEKKNLFKKDYPFTEFNKYAEKVKKKCRFLPQI